MSIEFFIPLLPGSALSPNGSRPHWSKVSAARKELREATFFLAMPVWTLPESGPLDPARVALTLQQTHKRPRDGYYRPQDIDNATAALKPCFDGLKDAGLIVDDTAEHIEPVVRIEWIDKYNEEGIMVRVETM